MYPYSNEEQEFNQFMLKLSQKALETRNDYIKLSDRNKAKVMDVLKQKIQIEGLIEFLNYLADGEENLGNH